MWVECRSCERCFCSSCRHCAILFTLTPRPTASVVRTSKSCGLCAPFQVMCWARCSTLVDALGAQLALARFACAHAYAVTVSGYVAIAPGCMDLRVCGCRCQRCCCHYRCCGWYMSGTAPLTCVYMPLRQLELLQVCVTLSDYMRTYRVSTHTRQQNCCQCAGTWDKLEAGDGGLRVLQVLQLPPIAAAVRPMI